jgi:sensor c-di-GMP phosphodiesterase-like protein
MAQSLKLDVVTEGVETEEQQDFLRQQGCELAQGYLYGMPCPGADFLSWLMQEQGKEDNTAR